MGFGLLFVGYFFNLSLPYKGVDILPDLIGCILMYLALNRLCGYCPDNQGFRNARILLYPYTVFATATLGTQVAGLFTTIPKNIERYFFTPLYILYSVTIGVYLIFLLTGIHSLSKSVELEKTATRARRLITLTVVYYFLQLLFYFDIFNFIANLTDSPDVVLSYINITIYVIGLIWLLLTLSLIFTCYMRICLEGDEDMPHRDSAFDRIVNQIKNDKK
jgi:uncharacterized membrane protein